MNSTEKSENLKRNIVEYIKENGWIEFFGLLSTLDSKIVELSKLEETKPVILEEALHDTPEKTSNDQALNIEEASIYAAEHLQAVLEDKNENILLGDDFSTQPKTKVLENPDIPSPRETTPPQNAWQGLEVVSPGQLKL